MNTLNDILEKVKKSGLMIVLGVFSFYFAINAIKGDRGFFKYLYLKGKVEAAQAERERYAAIKKIWNIRSQCFRSGRLIWIIWRNGRALF